MAGVSMILASCLMVHPIVHIRQREKNHKKKNINLVCEQDVVIGGKASFNKADNQEIKEHDEKHCEPFLCNNSKMMDTDTGDRIYEEIPCLDSEK
jgi:hypothetical protein